MMIRRWLLASALLGLGVLPSAALYAATLVVVNNDGVGEGFNDPTQVVAVGGNGGVTLGAQRLIAMQRAADIWGRLLFSPVTIRIAARFDPLPCSATQAILGSAGPIAAFRDFSGALVANTWYPLPLANALHGASLDLPSDDISAQFNSSIGTSCSFPRGWYYGLDENSPSGQIDFVSVAVHELGHGLGFVSFVDLASGAKALGFDDTFMRNLEDHGAPVPDYPGMSDSQRVAASIDTGNLHWVGANVRAASALLTAGKVGDHVRMYAPNPLQPASSVSHWDTSLAPIQVMQPSYIAVLHNPVLELPLFQDIGWTLLPDLALTALTAPVTAAVGAQITVSSTVSNQGAGSAGAFRLGFYLSTDAAITASDTLLASCQMPPLLAGSSTSCAGPVNLPLSLSPGVYYLGAFADDLGAVAESNKGNNTAVAQISLGAATGLPAAPTIGTATAGSGTISVAFTPGSLGSGTLVNYTADCGGIANTGGSSPITVIGLSNGISYSCRVKATTSVGDSPWSAFSNPATPVLFVPGYTVDLRSYIPAAVAGYSEYLRVINPGTSPTRVSVAVIDGDTGLVGSTLGTLTAALAANAAATYTAADVERALGTSINAASRPRIRVGAEHLIQAQSFMANPGGVITELSGAQSGTVVDVPTYIPWALNSFGYVSFLRLINPGGSAASVRVALIDGDSGAVGTAAMLNPALPPGAAITYNGQQIEAALGFAVLPATVRPRLRVTSTASLEVQSFMSNPGGVITETQGLQ